MTGPNIFQAGQKTMESYSGIRDTSKKTNSVAEEAQEVFSSILYQQNLPEANDTPMQTKDSKELAKTEGVDANEVSDGAAAYDKYQYKEHEVEQNSMETVTEKVEQLTDRVEELAEDIIADVMEQFSVSKEDVKLALNELGFTMADLLEPQKLAQFTLQLTEAQTVTNVLLDPQFQTLLENIADKVSELAEELQVPKNQMEQFTDALKEGLQKTELPVEIEAANRNADSLGVIAESVIAAEEEGVVSAVETETVVQVQTEEENTFSQELQEDSPKTEAVKDAVPTDTNDDGQQASSFSEESESFSQKEELQTSDDSVRESDLSFANAHEVAFSMENQTTITENVAKLNAQSYVSVDTIELIHQVAEQVRVLVETDTTTMELQLNPENLGKIYLNVSEKAGVVNAQIEAQNDTVRMAIEAQLATLRENLNQAGVKVDAIEVMVSSHAFEKNLEENEHQREQQEEQNKSRQRRSLRADSLDELSGLMTEAEALVAQIMKDNGNSVDLTA